MSRQLRGLADAQGSHRDGDSGKCAGIVDRNTGGTTGEKECRCQQTNQAGCRFQLISKDGKTFWSFGQGISSYGGKTRDHCVSILSVVLWWSEGRIAGIRLVANNFVALADCKPGTKVQVQAGHSGWGSVASAASRAGCWMGSTEPGAKSCTESATKSMYFGPRCHFLCGFGWGFVV